MWPRRGKNEEDLMKKLGRRRAKREEDGTGGENGEKGATKIRYVQREKEGSEGCNWAVDLV